MKRKYITNMLRARDIRVERSTDSDKAKLTCKQVFNTVVVRPLDFVCRLTIPCCDEKHWSRTYASFNPFFGVLTMLVGTGCKLFAFFSVLILFVLWHRV